MFSWTLRGAARLGVVVPAVLLVGGCGQNLLTSVGGDTEGDTADPGGPTSSGAGDDHTGSGTDDDTGDGSGDGDDEGGSDPCANGPMPGEICLWFDRSLATTNVPTAVGLVDVDGDGNLDVVVTTFEGDQLLVFPKDDALGFGTAVQSPVGQGNRHLVDLDLDGDGAPDLVLANVFNKSLSLVLNDGAGAFGFPSLVGIGGGTPRHLSLGDVDGDGALDLLAANEEDGVLFFRGVPQGDPGGPFEAPVAHETGTETYQGELVDMNGDGFLDIVALNRGSSDVAVLLGDGGGGFAEATRTAVGEGPRGMAVGDLDGDGFPEVVVASFDEGTMTTLKNDGQGGLASLGEPVQVGLRPYGVALADMDEDGDLDAVIPISGVDAVGVFPNLGDGSWGEGRAFLAGGVPLAVVVRDLDGDGRPEVLSIDSAGRGVTLLRSTPPD